MKNLVFGFAILAATSAFAGKAERFVQGVLKLFKIEEPIATRAVMKDKISHLTFTPREGGRSGSVVEIRTNSSGFQTQEIYDLPVFILDDADKIAEPIAVRIEPITFFRDGFIQGKVTTSEDEMRAFLSAKEGRHVPVSTGYTEVSNQGVVRVFETKSGKRIEEAKTFNTQNYKDRVQEVQRIISDDLELLAVQKNLPSLKKSQLNILIKRKVDGKWVEQSQVFDLKYINEEEVVGEIWAFHFSADAKKLMVQTSAGKQMTYEVSEVTENGVTRLDFKRKRKLDKKVLLESFKSNIKTNGRVPVGTEFEGFKSRPAAGTPKTAPAGQK